MRNRLERWSCKTAIGKIQRDFLLRVTEQQLLEPEMGIVAGHCVGCGRDVFCWELAFEYAAFDGGLYCNGCLRDKHLRECGGGKLSDNKLTGR